MIEELQMAKIELDTFSRGVSPASRILQTQNDILPTGADTARSNQSLVEHHKLQKNPATDPESLKTPHLGGGRHGGKWCLVVMGLAVVVMTVMVVYGYVVLYRG